MRAMMNGGRDDDIMAALANSLETNRTIDAEATWNKISSPPVRTPLSNGTSIITRTIKEQRWTAWQTASLFDDLME